MTISLRRRLFVSALLSSLLVLPGRIGFAQTNGRKTDLLGLPLPLSIEWSESFDLQAQNRLVADRFKFVAGTNNLNLQFSNQAPAFLSGKQFQWLPGGYQLTELALSRKWGSIYGFRSLGYSSRIVRPEFARSFTGAAAEVPRAFLGTRLTAYFLYATPQAQLSEGTSTAASNGSQVGFTLMRELRKDAKLETEWTQTHFSSTSSASGSGSAFAGPARRGLRVRLTGTYARTDLNITCKTRDEGLANPAAPTYGPAQRTLSMDVRRKFKKHQFQYSSQLDGQRAVPTLGITVTDVREETFGWTYAPRRLPQISASQTWSRQARAGKPEDEETFRVSLGKSIRRANTSLMFLRGTRADAQSSRPLWERTMLMGDVTVEIRKDERLHAHYETNRLSQPTISQLVSVSSLQFDTRISLRQNRLSLAPVLDMRRQGGSLPAFDQAGIRIALSALIKMPRYLPGTDLLIDLASIHARSTGRPDQDSTELIVRWNFRYR
jgi:hypothetical protein